MSNHTPGPWTWAQDGTLHASGNPLVTAGRTKRAIANRALLKSAPDLLAIAEQYVRALEYYAKVSDRAGDDEGARLKRLNADMIGAAIAAAKGAP